MAEASEEMVESPLLSQLLDSGRLDRLIQAAKKKKTNSYGRHELREAVSFPAGQCSTVAGDRHTFCFLRPSLPLIGIPQATKSSGMEEVTPHFSQTISATEMTRGVEEMDLYVCPPRLLPLQLLQTISLPEEDTKRHVDNTVTLAAGVGEEVKRAARLIRSRLDSGSLYGAEVMLQCSVLEKLTVEEWSELWNSGEPLEGSEWTTAVNGGASTPKQQNWSGLRQLQRLTNAKGLAEMLLVEKSALLWPRGRHVGKAALDLLQDVVKAAQMGSRSLESYSALMEAVEAREGANCVLEALSAAFLGGENREEKGRVCK